MRDPRVKDPKRVAAGKKAKRKGNSNEREVAKMLAEWWGSGEWMRTPSSGGWGRSKQVRADFNAAGDIVTTAADFPFCVESKSEEGWELEQLLRSPDKCPIAKWWDQTVRETPEGKHPLLLFTRRLRPWYAMLAIPALARGLAEPKWRVWIRGSTEDVFLTMADNLLAMPKETVLMLAPDTTMIMASLPRRQAMP